MRLIRLTVSIPTLLLAICYSGFSSHGANVQKGTIAILDLESGKLRTVADEPVKGFTICGSPCWSPDGKKIAYDAITPDLDWTKNRLFSVHVSGERKGETDALGYGTAPSWSPDGSQVAFTLNPSNPLGDEMGCWVMNADGTGREFLVQGWFARWSPTGRYLAFTPGLGAVNPQLFDLRQGTVRKLRITCDGTQRLSWSPDGKQLTILANGPNGSLIKQLEVAVQPKTPTLLYPTESQETIEHTIGMTDWSPDGKRLAIRMSIKDKHSGIFLYEADSGKPARLVQENTKKSRFANPRFSPDGKQLALTMSWMSE